MVCGSLAAMLHAVVPHFQLDKTVTSILLDADLIEDHDGRIATSVALPPALPPMTLRMSMAWFEGFALTYLPVRKVSDEEFDEMERINPPVRLSFRKCAFTSASVLQN